VLIIAESWTFAEMFAEIVTREGGRGKVKYDAYMGLIMVKSDMSFSKSVIEMIC
jgi:hypothetical protein